MRALAERTARGTALEAALAVLAPAFEALENGILIIDRGRTLFANAAMSGLVGVSAEVILAMPPASFGRHLASLIDDPPALVKDGSILGEEARLVCEEFELARPARSVVRWVSQRLQLGGRTVRLASC